jgi:hypothetical protein
MTTQEWKTVSVKLNEELRNAMELVCKRENITVNKFLTEIIAREVEPILNPSALPENKGVPQVGENRIKYSPETDSFTWQIDLGVNGIAILSDNISPIYLDNLKKAIEEATTHRSNFQKKNKKSAVIPSKLLKYRVLKK